MVSYGLTNSNQIDNVEVYNASDISITVLVVVYCLILLTD